MKDMKKILWIEDEKNHFDTFSKDIKNHNVKRVENYKSAIKEIESNCFDLFVVDIILPSGKKVTSREELLKIREIYYGLEIISYIRKKDLTTPIIVVSVVTSSHSINEKIKKIDSSIESFYKYDVTSSIIMKKIKKLIGNNNANH